ncbi:MAG: hypothetical protein JNM25_13710 [Planctomycetes bacterium]|nr:hypothetical protein [Planctomycetota bacterium]
MRCPTHLRAAACALLLGSACSVPAPSARDDGWAYRVALRDDGAALEGRLTLPAGAQQRVTVAAAATPFLDDVAALANGAAQRLPSVAGAFVVPAAAQRRDVRWRFRARDASVAIDDIEVAARRGGQFVGSLGAFLLQPVDGAEDLPFTLQVDAGPLTFLCAVPTTAAGWTGRLQDLALLPPCTFGTFAHRTVTAGAAVIEVADLSPRRAAGARDLDAWVGEAAAAMRDYWGVFPVPRLLLMVTPGLRPTITGGSARGLGGGARIFVDVPLRVRADDLRGDWVLFHEMVHLALPSLAPQHHWLEEGSAVYLEPLLQARAGRVREHDVWQSMLEDYPQGLAAADAGGLDDDASWGRTYYGGAIFCLRADVEIRRLTDNRRSLRDAMRGIVAAGGNISAMWPIEDVLRTGDEATGTTVLRDLYAAMRAAPEPRELQSLWRELGVRLGSGHVVFDDSAPLAAVRRALVLGR